MELDDNIESIFDCYKKMGYISKAGGGIGVYVGKLRPSKALLLGIPAANAITYWVKIINDIAIAVNQAGVRKGAITVGLDFWHKDIADFIEVKTEIGEFREKSFDIFPQILLNNTFMEKRDNNEDFWAVDRTEVMNHFGVDLTEVNETQFREIYPKIEEAYNKCILKNGIKHNAKDFWKRILTIYIETGDLYINNKDNMNFHNPVKDSGLLIKAGNLCCESFSPITPSTNYRLVDENGVSGEVCDTGLTHTCDLLSLNMAEILNDRKLLEYAVRKGIRALDNSMDITTTPSPEANRHNATFRTVGLGTVGIADWMAYNKLSYVKEQDWGKLEALFETIAFIAFDESCEIAKEKGTFLYYDKANFKDGILLGKTAEQLMKDSIANLPWDKLINKIKIHGIANMLLFSPAPNTSTAVLMGASASYLPVFSRFNYETMSNMAVPVIPKFIKDRFWYYNESFTIPTEKIIKLTTRLQKWVDTGMSMELIINPEITDIKKISDALIKGFKEGLKTVYYSRTLDLSKKNSDDSDIDDKPEVSCIGCAN
jgi:ribonucleoside-diphosphate reductase alpha chain